MRVVITGPTGTIGIALIKKYIDRGAEVLALCRKGSKGIAHIPSHPNIRIIEANLDEYKMLEISGSYDVFYHLAWMSTIGESRNDVYAQHHNTQFTLDAVQLAHRLQCHTFIGAGSQAEYGRSATSINAQTPTFPENGYGIAKLCAGQLSRILCEQLQIRHIWTRILSVYGPYDDENTMITSTLTKMVMNKELQFTAGEQVWDFIYSEDAGEILYRLALYGESGQIYCIGSGQGRPLRAFIEEMRDLIMPNQVLSFGQIPYGENQVMYLVADLTDLEEILGDFLFTPFSEGIMQTLEDVKTRIIKGAGE